MADRRVIAWAEPGQRPLIEDAVHRAGLDIAGVGGATLAAASELADALGVERLTDLRQTLHRDDVDLLWLASPEPIGADERRLIREVGLTVVSTEPRPMEIADLVLDPAEASTAMFVPLMRRSPGYRTALDTIDEFGQRQLIQITLGSGPGEGTLFARLFDAMDLLETLCGPADGIDAALAGPQASFPESLADLRGHMTLNVRFAKGRCASIAVSDRAGSWSRAVTIVGPAGRLRIDDVDHEWIGADGETVEAATPREPVTAGALVGEQMIRAMETRDACGDRPPDTARLLALCEAARLSCRTGQGETPQKLLEMLSRP